MTPQLRSQVAISVFVIALAGIHPSSAAADQATFTTYAGLPSTGSTDGTGNAARFSGPRGAAVDSAGNIFVADSGNSTIRMITVSGVVTTFAGVAGSPGSANGTGSAARFRSPGGMAFDNIGNLYVADTGNHTIRMITPGGTVTTLAGTAGVEGSDDGFGPAAEFSFPEDVAVDSGGNVFVADSGNATIRRITPAGDVTTFAGTAGQFGTVNDTGAAARFNGPHGLAIDSSNNVFVAEDNLIRKITPGAAVTTFAGAPGQFGTGEDGTGSAARFSAPWGLAIDGVNNLYVGDEGFANIRMITPGAVVTTLAGMADRNGSDDGNGSAARFVSPNGLAATPGGTVFVADQATSSVRMITPSGDVTTFAGVAGSFANVNGDRTIARFGFPAYVAFDLSGNLYVTQPHINTIRKIGPTGEVTPVAGVPTIFGSADGAADIATFADPLGIGVDSGGNVYVADSDNNTIRKITQEFEVMTFAGLANDPTAFADGNGTAARFQEPVGIAIDSSDNVYVADSRNHIIRMITPGAEVTTIAGSPGLSGADDGTGSAARFNRPQGLAIDSAGNLYVADAGNTAIRVIAPGGVVTTLAGAFGNPGTADGTGSAAQFLQPGGVTVDNSGNVFVTDVVASTIRKITPGGVVTTLAGTAGWYSSSDGTGTVAKFAGPMGIAFSNSGVLYVADSRNATIRRGTSSAAGDVDGDGRADLVVFRPDEGRWYTLPSGTGFTGGTSTLFGQLGDLPVPGDYDGDLRTDLAVFRPSDNTWRIRRSSNGTVVTHFFGQLGDLPVPGDYDGDLKTDLAVYRRATGTWHIRTSESNYSTTLSQQWGFGGDVPAPGDYDGDGQTDFAVYRPSNGTWYFLTSTSGSTVSRTFQFGLSGDVPVPGTYDSDGITDIAVFRPSTGVWFILRSTSDFVTSTSHQWGLSGDIPVPSDFDRDGKTDLAVFRPSNGSWYIARSTTNYATTVVYQWGLSTDIPAPNAPIAYALAARSTLATLVRASDFDADQRADLTVYRPSTSEWYTLQSRTNYESSTQVQWGLSGDIPVSHDYDGSRQTYAAVYRPSNGTWYATTGGTSASYQWGLSGDSPAPGDYDGDGISDPAVYRPSNGTWYILLSSSSYTSSIELQWGLSGDVPVQGDYDGDALTDPAVYRPSTGEWFIRHSTTGYVTSASYQWGLTGDISVPGEYDGDGRTDIAVYRPSTGDWFVRQSSTGYAASTSIQWGLTNDVPVPADFDGDRRTDFAVWRPSTGEWYLLKSSSNFTIYDAVQWGLPGDIPILMRE